MSLYFVSLLLFFNCLKSIKNNENFGEFLNVLGALYLPAPSRLQSTQPKTLKERNRGSCEILEQM